MIVHNGKREGGRERAREGAKQAESFAYLENSQNSHSWLSNEKIFLIRADVDPFYCNRKIKNNEKAK